MYNSDYEIRLATLAALGGDTSITYDSVYSIDLEILRLTEQGGGGEGLNWNQIENLLATSGVSEIIVNSSDSSITLDYDLLSQIGQGGGGGGDYVCVDSVDALSGITSPKDGAIAYVAGKGMWKYYADTAITKWLAYDVNYDALTQTEKNSVFGDYFTYKKETYFQRTSRIENVTVTYRAKLDLTYSSSTINAIFFASYPIQSTEGYLRIVQGGLNKNSSSNWVISGENLPIVFTNKNNECFDYTKKKLTNDGLTSIKFNSGSTSSITLDYDLVSQISQGGMDYNDVKTDLATSGLTKILVLGDSGRTIDLDYNLLEDIEPFDYAKVQSGLTNEGVKEILVKDSADTTSITLDYDLVSQIGQGGIGGGDYVCVDSVDALSGITNPKDGAIAYVAGKGMWKYYADTAITKWLAYDVEFEALTQTEKNTLCEDYSAYTHEVYIRGIENNNHFGYLFKYRAMLSEIRPSSNRIYFVTQPFKTSSSYVPLSTQPDLFCYCGILSPVDSNWTIIDRQLYDIFNDYDDECYKYTKKKLTNDGLTSIKFNSESTSSVTLDYNLVSQIASSITTQSSQFGLNIGGLFSVGLNETMSGVTISTTINLDTSATDENHIATITNKNSNRGYWEQLCEDGWLNGVTTAATNAEWFVLDYNNFWDGDVNSMVTPFAAVKVQDNGDSTFTITYFLSGNNWDGDNWETQYFSFEVDNERGYTWTVTQNQTLTVTPHLYTLVRYTHKNNTNNSLMYKLV